MSQRRYLLVPILAGLVMAPMSAPAQMSTQTDLRGFLGGGVGYYRLNDGDFLDEDDRLRDDQLSWKVFGGLEVNRIFALEVGYHDFGRARDGDARMEADGWTIAALAAIPITPVFAPYAKVGQLFWDRKRSFGPVSRRDDGNDMFYGLGARFSLTPLADLRLEYERMSLDDTDLDVASVNIQFRF